MSIMLRLDQGMGIWSRAKNSTSVPSSVTSAPLFFLEVHVHLRVIIRVTEIPARRVGLLRVDDSKDKLAG